MALVAGCGGEAAERSVAIYGGTGRQRALLRSIAEGLHPTAIRSVAIRNIGVVGFPGKAWVEISIRPRTSRRNALRAHWETYVLAGVFRDRAEEAGLGAVRYLNGGDFGWRHAHPAPSQEPVSPAARIAVARAVAQSAAEQRATVEQLAVLTPSAPAAVLVVRVDDPAEFVKHRFLPMVERWWTSPRLEGSRVLVLDHEGDPIFETMAATRLTARGSWIRPDLAACYPMVHFGVDPDDEPPPPCAAA